MEDTIDIKLPVSGKTVELRNYTTKADDLKSDAIQFMGVTADETGKVKIPISNLSAAEDVYVYRLVNSIDGDTSNIKNRLEDLRSEDYQAIADKVKEIVEAHSPKAKGAKNASASKENET